MRVQHTKYVKYGSRKLAQNVSLLVKRKVAHDLITEQIQVIDMTIYV